ncbi:MAG TPA: hypothetical protein VF100_09520, partial [Thermoanaerobaculia bacterium]
PLWWAIYGGLTAWLGPWIALVALWWLRPLFSRVPLHVLSRALFGEVPPARAVLRTVPRQWARKAAGDLTVRRIDPARSFDAPVDQLEGLGGRERRRRLAALRQDRHGTAMALTAVSALMELCLFVAALALLPSLTPEGLGIDWAAHWTSLFRGEAAPWYLALFGACAFVAFSVIEPFYVGGGFGLYLDRRTHLEGWDVELAFRRLARRLGPGGARRGGGRAAAMLAAVALGGMLAAGDARAAEPAAPGTANARPAEAAEPPGAAGGPDAATPEPPADPAEVARRILAGPDFSTRRKVETWQLRDELFDDAGPDAPPRSLGLAVGGFAAFAEVLLWAVAIGLLVLLVAWVVRQAGPWSRGRRSQAGEPPPAVLFGLDLTPESLPDDVPAAARRMFAAGRATEALGLLYRGALARLARRREVAASWTEEECVRHLADQLDAGGAAWFRRLAVTWQAAAYAHRPPDADAFAGLCGDWGRHLEAAA